MDSEKSVGHICFRDGYEFFWVSERSGRKYVVRADVANPIDPVSNQRVGGRFEGTEAWFQRFSQTLFIDNNATTQP